MLTGRFTWRLGVCTAALALLAAGGPAWADTVVVPNSLAGVEGNSNNGFPFNIVAFGLSSQRYQQVYAASQFTGVPISITAISFRPDADTGGAFSSTLPSIQINLSTTAATPDGLSATFASNVGGDDMIVFAMGPLSLSSSNTGGPPRAFDIVIPISPFLYNPGLGNLLLDVRNFGGGGTTQFDAEATTGDSISRVSSTTGVGAGSGGTDSLGLVTQFTFTPQQAEVPEPASLTLVGLGALALIGGAWRRRKQAA